jgi:hypothetical protein
MKQSLAATAGVIASSELMEPTVRKTTAKSIIKITDLKCIIMGRNPAVRITTDVEGISDPLVKDGFSTYIIYFENWNDRTCEDTCGSETQVQYVRCFSLVLFL